MDDEIWEFVLPLGDYYQVSNQGNVRSVDRVVFHKDGKITHHQSRQLKQCTNHKGYKVVYPTFGGKKKSLVVHRLVALAFHPRGEGQDEVNHKNEIKSDNHWLNLEWCDTAYNVDYSQSHSCKLVSPKGEVIEVTNYSKFSRENGLSNGKISMLVNGKRKSHKGWTLYATN
jgi:hypothetical protein